MTMKPRKAWKWWVRFNPECYVEENARPNHKPRVEMAIIAIEVLSPRRGKLMETKDADDGHPGSIPTAPGGEFEHEGRYLGDRIMGAAESYWEARTRARMAKPRILDHVRRFYRRQVAEARRHGIDCTLAPKEEDERRRYWAEKGWS